MSWLKPIFEKLQVNAFIGAICITSFICWLSLQNFLFLVLCICCGTYLLILLINFCIKNYQYNTEIAKRERDRITADKERTERLNFQINVWFSTLPQFTKNSLLKLLDWESIVDCPFIKVMGPNSELLQFNTYEFILEQGYGQEPIRLLNQYENPTPCSMPTYIIHPVLFEILLKYKNQERLS